MSLSNAFRGIASTTIAAVAAIGIVAVAAAPASAESVSTTANLVTATEPVGDGEWSPSHGEDTRVIPLCEGPIQVLDWLVVNFSDHGVDGELYVRQNWTTLTLLASGNLDPVTATLMLTKALAQIPAYAVADTVFHQPATLASVATGCGILGDTGLTSVLGR